MEILELSQALTIWNHQLSPIKLLQPQWMAEDAHLLEVGEALQDGTKFCALSHDLY